jgi:putative heme-binding domain-containing protein
LSPKPTEAQRELAAQMELDFRHAPKAAKFLKELREQAGPRPKGEEEWQAFLANGGDIVAGERLFFHSRGPRCYACHRIDGRGAAIGPDLSAIGRSMSRAKLVESIVQPSKEIAPQFQTWVVATRDGKIHTGSIVEEGPDSTITMADSTGKLEVINRLNIEERHASSRSIMPDNLPDLMTPGEFRDLIAFLSVRR